MAGVKHRGRVGGDAKRLGMVVREQKKSPAGAGDVSYAATGAAGARVICFGAVVRAGLVTPAMKRLASLVALFSERHG